MRVQQIMSTPLVTLTRETPLKDVSHVLLQHGVTGVPIVDASGSPVGIVSQSDLVREAQSAEEEALQQSFLARLRRRRTEAASHHLAADVMTAPAVTVEPQASAVRAAWLMTEHNVNRLVVVDRGVPVGMVTRTDLVRAFARSDDDVRAEIVAEVLPALDVSANDVEVTVSNGEVRLCGEVDDELEARWLPTAVRRVLGVVAVDSQLRARHPRRADTFAPLR